MTQSTNEFVRTTTAVSVDWIEKQYDWRYKKGESIQVCSGEWRPHETELDMYVFWEDPDWDDAR